MKVDFCAIWYHFKAQQFLILCGIIYAIWHTCWDIKKPNSHDSDPIWCSNKRMFKNLKQCLKEIGRLQCRSFRGLIFGLWKIENIKITPSKKFLKAGILFVGPFSIFGTWMITFWPSGRHAACFQQPKELLGCPHDTNNRYIIKAAHWQLPVLLSTLFYEYQ